MNEIINEYAQEALTAGFRVFIAERGTYGFFTDKEGKKVVSFGVEFGGIKLSGNYKSSQPRQCGTGWGFGEYLTPIEAFNAGAPRWATGGHSWAYTTLDQHLKAYQASSKYIELTENEATTC